MAAVGIQMEAHGARHECFRRMGGVDVQFHVYLSSALVRAEWSASRSGRLNPGTYWAGGCMRPRAGLDDTGKSSTDPSVVQLYRLGTVETVVSYSS
jgi:hypothetical protein